MSFTNLSITCEVYTSVPQGANSGSCTQRPYEPSHECLLHGLLTLLITCQLDVAPPVMILRRRFVSKTAYAYNL